MIASAVVVLGVVGTALWAADRGAWTNPLLGELREITTLEPVSVFPRTVGLLTARDAESALRAGRPWEAWLLVRDDVFDDDATPGAVMLGARAAAGWGGWTNVRSLLTQRAWLDAEERGEGWLLLGRAHEELGDRAAAVEAYRRYVSLPAAERKGLAQARLGGVLARAGDPRAAAEAYAAAASELPELEDWLSALRVEQEVAAGARTFGAPGARIASTGTAARARRVEAEARGWVTAGDPNRAIARLTAEESVLRAQGARAEAARLRLARADLLLRTSRMQEGRELLRGTAADGAALVDTRLAAARALEELSGRSAAEELALAAAYEAASRPGLAARALRAAMAVGGPSDAATQLRLARLLYEERDFGPARAAFQRAAEMLTSPEQIAEAEYYAARSLQRSSPRRVADAMIELRRVAERYPETPAAGSALFTLGDVASTTASARTLYRRAAAIERSPDAREALYRAGDRALRLRDPAGAIAAWEEYVARYPAGEVTARVAYETAKLHESAGRESRARAMYTAAMLAEPVSYYAMRAGDRLGVSPLDRVLAEPRPWLGLASDPAAAALLLRRLETLQELGLEAEWKAEFEAATRSLRDRPAALIALAEGVRDRGHPVEAINLGWQLYELRGRQWDNRLLRVVYPFLYREILVEEAERQGVDPMLLAGLVRQESSFRAAVKSRVGATGLGQIMPATGRGMATAAGIRSWDPSLLEVPEVNLRMAASYLSWLMERYDGTADLALSGYNAGPGRADRWRRQLPRRDRDAFRDAIPFAETREYVKIVLRNAEVYERLYGR